MPQFDVGAAKKAGYSDDEIIGHLTQSRKFDIDGARKAGYSNQDIIGHLSAKPAASSFTPEGAPGIPKPDVQMQESPGFGSRLYDSTVGVAKGLGEAYAATEGTNPLARAAEAFIVNPAAKLVKDTINSKAPLPLKPLDAIGGMILPEPVVRDMAEGNLEGLAGSATGIAATAFLPAAARGAVRQVKRIPTSATAAANAIESKIPQRSGPMSGAVEYAESQGLPTTVGERTGSRMLQTAERTAEVIPGASGTASEFYSSRNAKVAAKGKELTERVGKVAEDPTAAGGAVKGRIEDRASQLKDFYGKRYDAVEKSVDRATQKRQAAAETEYQRELKRVERFNNAEMAYTNTRRQLAADAGLDPERFPMPKLKPEPVKPEPVVPAPVEMSNIKSGLRDFYDELTRTMPTTQRESSPGYLRVKNIVEDSRTHRGALDLERDLGEIKRLLRSESKGYAATPSGRYAMASIKELENGITTAIEESGGYQSVLKLKQARAGVKEMHRTFEALDKVLPKGESPVKLFERLTAARDTNLSKLVEIKKRAPEAVADIGATYLEGALSKLTGEAGTADMSAVTTAWKRLGPRTKRELFGAQTEELNAFFEHAPALVRNINKSGSGNVVLAGKLFGAGGTLVGALVGGGMSALPEAAAIAGAGVGSANAIGKFLFRPGSATKVRKAMASDPTTAVGRIHWKRLNAAVEADADLLATLQIEGNAQSGPQANR